MFEKLKSIFIKKPLSISKRPSGEETAAQMNDKQSSCSCDVNIGNGIEEIESGPFNVFPFPHSIFDIFADSNPSDEDRIRFQLQSEACENVRRKRQAYFRLLDDFFRGINTAVMQNRLELFSAFLNDHGYQTKISKECSCSYPISIKKDNTVYLLDPISLESDSKIYLSYDNFERIKSFCDAYEYRWELNDQGIFQYTFSPWGAEEYTFGMLWDIFVDKCKKISYDDDFIYFEMFEMQMDDDLPWFLQRRIDDNKKYQLICEFIPPATIAELSDTFIELKNFLGNHRIS